MGEIIRNVVKAFHTNQYNIGIISCIPHACIFCEVLKAVNDFFVKNGGLISLICHHLASFLSYSVFPIWQQLALLALLQLHYHGTSSIEGAVLGDSGHSTFCILVLNQLHSFYFLMDYFFAAVI